MVLSLFWAGMQLLGDEHIRLASTAAYHPDGAGFDWGGLFFLRRLFGLCHQLAQLFFKFLFLLCFHAVFHLLIWFLEKNDQGKPFITVEGIRQAENE